MKTNNKIKTFKVIGHRPFDNNNESVNIIKADSPESAKKSMINFYGFRNNNNDNDKKPNIIIDSITEIKC